MMQVQRSSHRRVGAALAALVALVVVGAATAWACTPQASVSVTPGVARAGSRVTVVGSEFNTQEVDVRWSGSPALLGRATGPNFSVVVTIPAGTPTKTYVISAGYSASGQGTVASTTVDVRPDAPQDSTTVTARSSEAATSGETSTGGATAGGTGSPEPGTERREPATGTQASGGAWPGMASGIPERGGASSTEAAVASQGPASVESPASIQDSAVRQRTSSSAAASTPAKSQTATSGGPAGTPAGFAEDAELRGPSPQTAISDAWSGFQPGSPIERGPSLTDPIGPSGSQSAPVGALVLLVGLVGLAAGFGVTELRRRPVAVR